MEYITEELIRENYENLFKKSFKESVQFCTQFGRQGWADYINFGKIRFDLPKAVKIPKKNGEYRRILVSPPTDRMLMIIIYKYLIKNYIDMIHPSCVSYLPKVSVPKILREIVHGGKLKGIKLDISKFFEQVPIEVINDFLDNFKEPFMKNMKEFYNTNVIIDEQGYKEEFYKSLCQGCAVSAFLADALLRYVDEIACSHNVRYYRYCDDMIILTNGDDSEVERAAEDIKNELAKISLSIKEEKTEYFDGEVTFLGGYLTESQINISSDNLRKLKHEIKGKINKKRVTLANTMKDVQRALFLPYNGRTRIEYFFSLCTNEKDFADLDEYLKQTIKAHLTKKHNYTHNNNKYPDSELYDLGWVNLTFLYNVYKNDYEVFKAYCRKCCAYIIKDSDDVQEITYDEAMKLIGENEDVLPWQVMRMDLNRQRISIRGKVYKPKKVDMSVDDFTRLIKNTWEVAKYYESDYAVLNIQGHSEELLPSVTTGIYFLLTCLIMWRRIPMNERWIKIDNLVIFKEWVN